MRRLNNKFIKILNNFKLRKKLIILYVGCVLLPLIITDSVILKIIIDEENYKIRTEQEAAADGAIYDLRRTIQNAQECANKMYANKYMHDFLETSFESQLEYFSKAHEVSRGLSLGLQTNNISVTFCSNNGTIISSGDFVSISKYINEDWMKEIRQEDKKSELIFYYLNNRELTVNPKRQITYIRKLDYFKNDKYDKYVKCDINYLMVVNNLINMNYSYPVYVCSGNTILYSNDGHNNYHQSFDELKNVEQIDFERSVKIAGMQFRVVIMKTEKDIFNIMKERSVLFCILIAFNIILPIILVKLINDSFTIRMRTLSDAFKEAEIDDLQEIDNIQGKDEIGDLMRSYNKMVIRSNELIKTVYLDKMEKQDIDLARQHAELLALQSQINPHFLFNTLESIRMHSVLKNEQETSEMIAKLSILVRKNVEWKTDVLSISEEARFIENYLMLQKYRFGDKLDYEIFIDAGCGAYNIPKLTLVTFVENACVHGMENKKGVCKIYVRVYEEGSNINIEIEDTGSGISEKKLSEIKYNLQNCNISMLKESSHIGIVNAYLRLKMYSDNAVNFDIESEENIGTFFLLSIPKNKMTKEEVEINV